MSAAGIDEAQARRAMEGSVFGVAETARHFSRPGSLEKLEVHTAIQLGAEQLAQYRQTHVLMLFPAVSVWDVCRAHKVECRLRDKRAHFALRTAGCYWGLVRKEPVPGSPGLSWGEQQALLADGEVPTAAREQLYATVAHSLWAKAPLCKGFMIRCSDADPAYPDRRILVTGWAQSIYLAGIESHYRDAAGHPKLAMNSIIRL